MWNSDDHSGPCIGTCEPESKTSQKYYAERSTHEAIGILADQMNLSLGKALEELLKDSPRFSALKHELQKGYELP